MRSLCVVVEIQVAFNYITLTFPPQRLYGKCMSPITVQIVRTSF